MPNKYDAMKIEDLAKLTVNELEKIKRKNLMLFNVAAAFDLLLFYHSLFYENWILLFLSFGFFVAVLALYDNYKVSDQMILEAERSI